MTEKFFQDILTNSLQHEPTLGQLDAISKLYMFLSSSNQQQVYILKGYAGTGKTSLLSALIRVLPDFNINSVLLAPTGRAAKVLSGYAGKPAFTIHKIIYRQNSKSDFSKGFSLNFNKYKNTIFIVDEASMIADSNYSGGFFGSGCLFSDLMAFINSGQGCRLILCGDDAQLPPVESENSPALQSGYVESFGYEAITVQMQDVVRQSMNSGILSNANLVRSVIQGFVDVLPRMKTTGFADIESIDGSMLIETIETNYNNYGIDQTKIITRTNKQANRYNQGIRARLFLYEEELVQGDRLMVVKNNYFWLPDDCPVDFIANGDMVRLVRLRRSYTLFGCRFVDAVIRLTDVADIEVEVKLLTDTLLTETASMPQDFYAKMFAEVEADYQHIETKAKRTEAVMSDPFMNALQIKHAYAVTCHKAQGGQWQSVFIDHGWIGNAPPDISFFRWLYTAITRATEKLYFVNFNKEFVEN